MNEIHMAGPWITEDDINIVNDALRNGWYGKEAYHYVELFQKEFAAYHGRKYGIMTPNCSTAIHLLMKGLNIGPGDQVIAPDVTWIGSVAGIKWAGATTILSDIDEHNWCLSPDTAEDDITTKTKAIITVNLHGNMSDMDRLIELSEEYDIPLIEDAAQSLGSTYRGIRSGKFGIASVFSFHRTKTITTGEGGMILTDDDDLYERCMFLRDHGRSKTKAYWIDEIATKYMPFNVQAAMGYAQFLRIDQLVDKKREQLKLYKDLLSDVPDLQFNAEPSYVKNGAWVTGIIIGKSHGMEKEELIARAAKIGVPLRPFFYPLSSMEPYEKEPCSMSYNSVAYDISERGINLPCAFNLTEDQMRFVCNGIKSILL